MTINAVGLKGFSLVGQLDGASRAACEASSPQGATGRPERALDRHVEGVSVTRRHHREVALKLKAVGEQWWCKSIDVKTNIYY